VTYRLLGAKSGRKTGRKLGIVRKDVEETKLKRTKSKATTKHLSATI
jgi:hypothetical protein